MSAPGPGTPDPRWKLGNHATGLRGVSRSLAQRRTLRERMAAGAALPTPPASITAPVYAYEMGGNDTYGDCGPVGLQHLFEAIDVITGTAITPVPDAATVKWYLAYNQGWDVGVYLDQLLAMVYDEGWSWTQVEEPDPGFPATGYDPNFPAGNNWMLHDYAPVTVTDHEMLKLAIARWGGVLAGITVTLDMETWFEQTHVWPSAPPDWIGPAENHAITPIGYDAGGVYAVCWGAIVYIHWACWDLIVVECWAVIPTDEVAAQTNGRGSDIPTLEAGLHLLDQPFPPEEIMGVALGIFVATVKVQVPGGPAPGTNASFLSLGCTLYRYLPPESLANVTSATGPGQWFNGGVPPAVWGGGSPVGDLASFGVPADAMTAGMLALTFP
jgi:hypothetical protein